MPGTHAADDLRLSRRFVVETPEHVSLELELAGTGSRAGAAIYDAVILGLLLFLVGVAAITSAGAGADLAGWALALWIALGFAVFWGYFVLFEALAGGRTPGKRRLGIRVVMDTGHPVTFSAAAIRNLVRIVDAQPGLSYLLGLIFVFFHPRSKRLGDIAAGTLVVRDRPEETVLRARAPQREEALDAGAPRLSDEEFRLLEGFMDRVDGLDPRVRARFTAELVNRFADRFPERDANAELFLARLHSGELGRRQSRTAVRRAGGVTRAVGTAQRFVALRTDEWEHFRAWTHDLRSRGVRSLSGEELTGFAAAYREVAADLARARTYGVDARILGYLERLVASGHNLLYGMRGVRRPAAGRLLLRELPAAVVAARGYVWLAFVLFTVPALLGYTLIVERPEIAYEIIPDVMIARAESGAEAREAGRGYAETASPYLPIVASSIIANNVQVAFSAFAFGVTAGIGTVFVLVFNGLFFGSVLGLFRNYGLADWILTFVAGHGVLELTAIFIAGGAGLLIGRAILAPGDLARRDALVLNGRLALKLLGASASLLLLAGLIEGFLSASDASPSLKIGVAAASALLLILYFEAGRRAADDLVAPAAPAAPRADPIQASRGHGPG